MPGEGALEMSSPLPTLKRPGIVLRLDVIRLDRKGSWEDGGGVASTV